MKDVITESKDGWNKHLFMRMPFDKRHKDPSKNYGIHGMDLVFILEKDKNAVQFVAYLPVYLPHVCDEMWNRNIGRDFNPFRGMGADVGYHASKPQYENQGIMDENCCWLNGPCYYDGSGLRAEEWYSIFLLSGPDKIWEMLKEDWLERFDHDL